LFLAGPVAMATARALAGVRGWTLLWMALTLARSRRRIMDGLGVMVNWALENCV